MKCFIKRTLILGSLGISLPFVVLATTVFQGPSATPPSGNVPGVIWNMTGTGQTQTGALIDIDQIANFGLSSGINDIDGDIGLESGKAFRIDYDGSADFNMMNWYVGLKPLSFNLWGDIYAYAIGPMGAGQEGRVQADKFCFHPGDPTDCITSWSGIGGDYVLKTGDTMSGTLKIYDNNMGLSANGSSTGVVGNADGTLATGGSFYGTGYGVKGVGGALVGGDFSGPWGVYSRGSDIGVYGWANGATSIGGQFYGALNGVSSTADLANSIGLKGLSNGNGGIGVKGSAPQTNGIGGSFDGSYLGISAVGVGAGGSFQGTGADGIGARFTGVKNGISIIASDGPAISATGTSRGIQAEITGTDAWDIAVLGGGGSWGGIFTGSQTGAMGKNTINQSEGRLGSSLGYGVEGKGSIAGVQGEYTPNTANYGKLGTINYGAEGHGSTAGVYAIDSDNGSYAYIGTGNYGGTFYGNSYGVLADGALWGLKATDNTSNIYGYVGYGDYSFYGNGNIYVSGIATKSGTLAWQTPSDGRLKDVLGDYKYGLDEIGRLEIKKYRYKEDNALKLPSNEEYVGLIAQDVEKVIPEAVGEDNGYKTLKADPIIWAMLNSIKELKTQNEELKARIEVLEKK